MEYIIHLAIISGIYIILTIGLNLVVGYTGLLSVTHAAFYGIGAYVSTLVFTKLGWGFFWALPIAILVTAFIGLLIGVVLSKFREDYYALVSMGFNVIVFSILLNWQTLTHGPLGIAGIPRPQFGGFVFLHNFSFLLLVALLAIATYLIARRIVGSSFGRVLKSIREDETATQVFGYNTKYYKLTIFVISAALAAIAGALFATYITFIEPTSFTIDESIFILAATILGGVANLKGSVLGAFIMVLLPEFLRFVGLPNDIAAQMRQIIYGLVLILLMFYRPQGLWGEYKL